MAPAVGATKLPGSGPSATAIKRERATRRANGDLNWRSRAAKRGRGPILPTPIDGFDPTDRPSAGTACARCFVRGHFCPAKGYAGETALCAECGGGKPCQHAEAIQRMRSGAGMYEAEVPVAPVRRVPLKEARKCDHAALDLDSHVAAVWPIKATLSQSNIGRKKPTTPKRFCAQCLAAMHPATQGTSCRKCKRRLHRSPKKKAA